MSNAITRKRIAKKYREALANDIDILGAAAENDINIFGDSTETAAKVTSYITPLASGVSEMLNKNAEEAKAKAKTEQQKQLIDAAQKLRTDAENAKIDALGEPVDPTKPMGPAHVTAAKAEAAARAAEIKAGLMSPGIPGSIPSSGSSNYFTAKNVAIGAGVLLAGFVGYKIVTRHHGAVRR